MIIQTILLYRSGSAWTDAAPNVSRHDPSGAVQVDAEQLLPSSRRWVALVVGEVPVRLLAGRSLGDGVDQELTADERALPGRAPATERLGLVAAGTRPVDADL